MAQITLNREFNFWDILITVNVQPREQDKYVYSVQGDTATLTVYDVTQQQLDDALDTYDHQKYLDSLPPQQPTANERIVELKQENKLLQLQVDALTGQTEFLEETLTELILTVVP